MVAEDHGLVDERGSDRFTEAFGENVIEGRRLKFPAGFGAPGEALFLGNIEPCVRVSSLGENVDDVAQGELAIVVGV